MKRKLGGTIRRSADGSLYCHNDSLLRRIIEEVATVFLLAAIFSFGAALFLFNSYGSNDNRTIENAETFNAIEH